MREQRYSGRVQTCGGSIAYRNGPRPMEANRFHSSMPDEFHIPISVQWHADAVGVLKKFSDENKIITADTMKTAMARARWTVSHSQAAKFLFWAHGRKATIGGRWPYFSSNSADSSKLNESAVYSYDAPAVNLLGFLLSLFKRKQK